MSSTEGKRRRSAPRASTDAVILALIANQQETMKYVLALMKDERAASTAREDATWKRAEIEKQQLRAELKEAHADALKVKVIARSPSLVPAPQQQVMPFANGHRKPVFRPGVDDSATP